MISTSLLLLLNTTIKTYAWDTNTLYCWHRPWTDFTALSVCVQALAGPKHVSYAVSMYNFMRTFGMCIGVSVSGTVFQNRAKYHLAN